MNASFPNSLLKKMVSDGLLFYDGQRYYLHNSIKKALPLSPISLTSAIAYFQHLKQVETPIFEHLTNTARKLWSPTILPSSEGVLKKLAKAGMVRYDGQRYYLHNSIKKALPLSPISLTSAIAYFQHLKQVETPIFEHLTNTARKLWSPSLNNLFEKPKPKLFNKLKAQYLKQGGIFAVGLGMGYFFTSLFSQCPIFFQAKEPNKISNSSQQNFLHLLGGINFDQGFSTSSGLSKSEMGIFLSNFSTHSDNTFLHLSTNKSSIKVASAMTVNPLSFEIVDKASGVSNFFNFGMNIPFSKGKNYSNISFPEASTITAVPEPLTILGTLTAASFGAVFRWKSSQIK